VPHVGEQIVWVRCALNISDELTGNILSSNDTLYPEELFGSAGLVLSGSLDSQETLARDVSVRFPQKPFCLVEKWTIFRVDLTPEEIAKVHAGNHLPLFLFAHKVVEDSRGRFQPGDWVRSSMCVTLKDGVMFETKNTIYVLMGAGQEQTASLKTIFSFF